MHAAATQALLKRFTERSWSGNQAGAEYPSSAKICQAIRYLYPPDDTES